MKNIHLSLETVKDFVDLLIYMPSSKMSIGVEGSEKYPVVDIDTQLKFKCFSKIEVREQGIVYNIKTLCTFPYLYPELKLSHRIENYMTMKYDAENDNCSYCEGTKPEVYGKEAVLNALQNKLPDELLFTYGRRNWYCRVVFQIENLKITHKGAYGMESLSLN